MTKQETIEKAKALMQEYPASAWECERPEGTGKLSGMDRWVACTNMASVSDAQGFSYDVEPEPLVETEDEGRWDVQSEWKPFEVHVEAKAAAKEPEKLEFELNPATVRSAADCSLHLMPFQGKRILNRKISESTWEKAARFMVREKFVVGNSEDPYDYEDMRTIVRWVVKKGQTEALEFALGIKYPYAEFKENKERKEAAEEAHRREIKQGHKLQSEINRLFDKLCLEGEIKSEADTHSVKAHERYIFEEGKVWRVVYNWRDGDDWRANVVKLPNGNTETAYLLEGEKATEAKEKILQIEALQKTLKEHKEILDHFTATYLQ